MTWYNTIHNSLDATMQHAKIEVRSSDSSEDLLPLLYVIPCLTLFTGVLWQWTVINQMLSPAFIRLVYILIHVLATRE